MITIINKRFRDANIDSFTPKTEGQRMLIDVFKRGIESGFEQNILICGGVGLGKTHLSFAVLNALAEVKTYEGVSWYDDSVVSYVTIKRIIDRIRQSWKEDKPVPDDLQKVPLLIIDEIGVQYGTESERIELYEVFNERWQNMLPIIAVSNLDLQQIQKVLGQRIYDRLTDNALTFNIRGHSNRVKNKIIEG